MRESATPSAGGEALRRLAVAFFELGRQLSTPGPATAFDALTRVAVERVDGADWASITTYQDGVFTTVSATDERARRADAIQYELHSGPCVDAIVDDSLYNPSDLSNDNRWPEYGKRVTRELGVASMLSYRLATDEVIGGLNLYSERAHAFDDEAVEIGLLLATHGAMALAAATSKRRVENLEHALENSREIGTAIGVLMARYVVTREQAFDLLRVASQRTNRKINDIAHDVADTGVLPNASGHVHLPAQGDDSPHQTA